MAGHIVTFYGKETQRSKKMKKKNYLVDMDVVEVVLIVQRLQQSMYLSNCPTVQRQQKCNFHFVYILFGHQFSHLRIKLCNKTEIFVKFFLSKTTTVNALIIPVSYTLMVK